MNDSGKIKGSLRTIKSDDKKSAYCEATCSVTNEILKGMTYTLDIAKAEGLIDKQGSKWKTMPELMLSYRAQSNFINEFFPEVKFGCKTKEEIEDTDGNSGNNSKSNGMSEKASINDINSLLTSKKDKPETTTIDAELITPTPKELLINELLNRGLTQEEAGKWCYGKSDDIFNSYLNDPASIDTILEEIRGF